MTPRTRLLHRVLKDAGPKGVTTSDLLEFGVGSRFGARLKELRDEGYQVSATREKASSWRYVLQGVERTSGLVATHPRYPDPAQGESTGSLSAPTSVPGDREGSRCGGRVGAPTVPQSGLRRHAQDEASRTAGMDARLATATPHLPSCRVVSPWEIYGEGSRHKCIVLCSDRSCPALAQMCLRPVGEHRRAA